MESMLGLTVHAGEADSGVMGSIVSGSWSEGPPLLRPFSYAPEWKLGSFWSWCVGKDCCDSVALRPWLWKNPGMAGHSLWKSPP